MASFMRKCSPPPVNAEHLQAKLFTELVILVPGFVGKNHHLYARWSCTEI